ncbi:hypothetical protein [Roseateles flavus]|uniref:Solute-binding protein family 3/N-terminal domain-containing protein n=1 Tax=Roseateles flavus TaxID=3149041 RepID=A0ABV0G9X3_9BURK
MPCTAHPCPVPLRRQLLLAACAAGMAPGAQAQPPLLIRHNMADGDESTPPYRLQVLRLLLDRTLASHGPYALRADGSATTQSRALAQLRAGDLDVWASMCSRSRQDAGLSIPICLRRGVNGVRLPVVLAERRGEFEGLRHPMALRTYRYGQVSHWPDVRVLAGNGFKLEAVQTLEAFPAMLRLRRFDIFLLAADEAHAIVEAHPDLLVLDRWCLAYPSVYGFFVNARQPALARRLREGWAQSLADGSFAALFDAHLGPQLQRAQLDKRLWFRLPNPDLPEGMPLRERGLWHPLVWQRLLAPAASLKR